MATLLDKIESSAAQRLTLAAGTPPAQELARYRRYLKVESHRLKMLHRAGAGGREVCQARAAVLNSLIRHILDAVQQSGAKGADDARAVSVVAIGGYGRGELNPFSDIDIMFLHAGDLVSNGKPKPSMSAVTDGLLYTLWDIGLKVGHSVRGVAECAVVAGSDMQSQTSLIESRLIAGPSAVFEQMQRVLVAKCVRGREDEYIAARIADQEARRNKFGNSAYLQEPNIKNGSGALRDYQNLLWMIYFKFRARTLREIQERELITSLEQRQLEAAYDYLLRVRTELHYQSNRAVDVLSRNAQPAVAHNLGFTDRSPGKRVEKFMRVVYTHMRNIYLITRTLEQRLALAREPRRFAAISRLWQSSPWRGEPQQIDGFRITHGKLEALNARIFRDQPRRLIRAFLHAQQRGLELHPDLAQAIRHHLTLVDRSFLADPHVHQTFLEILNQRGNVGPILRVMHELGFLGKYLPEFGRLTCLVQHEFFHQHTTDEHTLICLEKLDQIWDAQEPPFGNYKALFQGLDHPYLLYLALLLHDAGKASQCAKHSDASARIAARAAKRLGLDGAATHSLVLIIEHHLLMAQVSQRHDLDDPSVIRNFMSQIQTLENLNLLTLLTFADSQGTSPDLWNGFKESLLWGLYHRASSTLNAQGDSASTEARQRELMAEQVQRLMPQSFGLNELKAHFKHMPDRYFSSRDTREIVSDLALAHRFMHLQIGEAEAALEPVLHWHNEPDRGYTAVTICTWDRAGLFSKIVGCLAKCGLNVFGARIYSRSDGVILDYFQVTEAPKGALVDRAKREEFERLLKEALRDSDSKKTSSGSPAALAGAAPNPDEQMIPTIVTVDNRTSDYTTVIQVQAEDRVGLLHAISQTLAELDLNLVSAKIATEKGAAIDSFNVTTTEGGKVTDPDIQRLIETQVERSIRRLPIQPPA